MKEVAVENIIELPNPLKDRADSFIIELQTPKDVRDVLMKKTSYFKLHKSDISVNEARTRKERERQRTLDKARTDESPTEIRDRNSI